MVNFKFRLLSQSERVILCLAHIVRYLESVKETGEDAPFPIREIKTPQDSQNMSFKFVCPARDKTKKVRINIFHHGKVNILGASDFESPRAIYGFISALIKNRWDDFVDLGPLPDPAPEPPGEPC